MRTAFVTHSDCSRHDTGWGHPEHQGRLPAVARAVYRDMLMLFDALLEMEGVPAVREDLLLAHSPEWIERVAEASRAAGEAGRVEEMMEGGPRVSGASWEAATAAVGCGLTAADAVLDGGARNAFCAVRPPGAGASRERSDGFALFNTIAIVARHLRERRGVERVLVVEWAARGGAGTASILASDPAVRFASVHRADEAVWPDEVLRAPVRPGASGEEVAAALDRVLEASLEGFAPDFVLLSAGLDLLAPDPLGGLAVEPREVHTLTARVVAAAEAECGGRLVSVLEGGYDPSATGLGVVQHLRALTGLEPA